MGVPHCKRQKTFRTVKEMESFQFDQFDNKNLNARKIITAKRF